ncbi:unnamed protein product [Ambrosiozyma monospora]|uniref:Unnamed protein product n=1 Tax=Ambrosiozyma monospora TaxID=43982 RepID=A0ACB5TJY7_AMBMO|nr:unnamed protein product [Ambrosiozyma monospora]
MLLGEESRWNDFVPCYERFCKLLEVQLNYAKTKIQKEYSTIENVISGPGLRTPPSDLNFSYSRSQHIPYVLKKAHWAVWDYRLKQLVEMGELKNIVQEVESLKRRGIELSNKNLNDTAIALSKNGDLVQTAIEFIDKFLLPGTMRAGLLRRKRAVTRWINLDDKYPRLDGDAMYEINKNITTFFLDSLSPENFDLLYQALSESKSVSILNILPVMKFLHGAYRYIEPQAKSRRQVFMVRKLKEKHMEIREKEELFIKHQLGQLKYKKRLRNIKSALNILEEAFKLVPKRSVIRGELEAYQTYFMSKRVEIREQENLITETVRKQHFNDELDIAVEKLRFPNEIPKPVKEKKPKRKVVKRHRTALRSI